MNPFNLEEQYQKYLKMVELKETTMHPVQRLETRRAFMGACGIMLVLLREDVAALPEDEAIGKLEDMNKQVKQFLIDQTKNLN